MFGGAYLRDKPTLVRLIVKDSRASVEYVLDDDHGMMLNPGEPVAYCHAFHAPGEATDLDKHIRVLEITPWEQIKSIELEYPTVELTDPATWNLAEKPERSKVH